MTLDSEVLGK